MSSFYTYAKHYGNSILYRGIENGKRVTGRRDFKPTMFVKSDKPSKYKSMYGESVSPIQFDSNKEAAEFAERYKEVSNFPIYGQTNWNYQFLTEKYPNDIDWDINQIKIFSVDIETTVENGFPDVFNPLEQILLITLQDNVTKKIITFGTGPFTQTSETSQYDVDYRQCRDEREMLVRFLDWWSVNTPDVLTGWNTDFFDVPYLISRVERVLDDDYIKMFSPFKLVRRNVKKIMGREQLTYEIQGVAQLDYLALYKKFTYITRPSYKLDNIAETELGKKKLESGFDTFREFYEKDWNRFVEYNIIDTALVDELEDKMKLIELILTMAYDAKCNFQDVFSPVRTWDSLLYNHLWKQNVVLPQSENKQSRSIVGAYVQEVEPGEYEWVASFDATSLYPSIIMQYNMSPETLVPGSMMDVTVDGLLEGKHDLSALKEKNYSMTANGQCFTNDKLGYMPEIVQKFFDDRQKYKKLMLKAKQDLIDTGDEKYKNDISKYNNFQMARKIQLNSLYGAMANQYFRFYDDRIAEGITMSGQHIIRQTAVGLDKFLNKVCGTENEMYSFYSDTDSCYITLKGLVDKYYSKMDKDKLIDVLDKIGDEQIEPCIAKSMDELAEYTNAFAKKLVFKREAIADRAIWIAKKRYAMNVYDNEGVRYQTPDLKVMGLEIVRSSTPACVQDSLKEAVRLCLTSDEATLQEYIKKTRKEFVNLPAEDIAFPRGCNNLHKYTDSANIYAAKTPMQVRGSLLYNFYLKKHKLDQKYEMIQEGDKIKFLYLKEPNTLKENCISFNTKIPTEFNIHRYVDYDLMFEKAFLDPMNTIVQALGWQTEKENTLEDLFS
jgi:DNA polymerase elongation subunit (family B)